ncbi:hypothetical protein C8R45DRAFT_1110023 [Mycena sanguinolenta]|nr:hypothetical protein C8R45DRAFT_1110023 [Mycena sanguinolenta]
MAFLDRPVELILIIAEFSAIDGGLLHLAASGCRRLNLLLVPLLFARRSNSLGKSYRRNAYRPPRARNRVLRHIWYAQSRRLVLPIPYNVTVHLRGIFAAAHAVNWLTTRLHHLGHLRFNPFGAGKAAKELVEWSAVAVPVRNSVAGREDYSVTVYNESNRGCVVDPIPFEHVFPAGEEDSDAPRALTSILRPVPPRAPLPLPANPRLTTFTIRTPFLFDTTFFPWTIHLCNTAPLTSLSLMHINFAHYGWALILPKLTMGGLKELRVLRCQTLVMSDLVQFLAWHVQITVLDLGGSGVLRAFMPPILLVTLRLLSLNALDVPPPSHITHRLAGWLLYFPGPPDFSAPTYSPTTTFFSSFSLWSGPFASTAAKNGQRWYPALRNITAHSVKSWNTKDGDDPSGPHHAAQLALAGVCCSAGCEG